MTRPPDSRVIVLSGTSSAGKTSLVKRTAELLGDAACLHFDDYASVSVYPADLAAWVAAGADPNEWRTPEFAADLRSLRQGQAVSLPRGRGTVEPKPYILVEDPFGRSRREMASSVDYVVYLDIPLDVAMVRKIRRDVSGFAQEVEGADLLRWVNNFCEWYLEGSLREAYRAGNEHARAGADLVLDAMRPLEDLAREIVHRVEELYNG